MDFVDIKKYIKDNIEFRLQSSNMNYILIVEKILKKYNYIWHTDCGDMFLSNIINNNIFNNNSAIICNYYGLDNKRLLYASYNKKQENTLYIKTFSDIMNFKKILISLNQLNYSAKKIKKD